MRWSLRIGRVKGTEIRVHVTFLLLLGVIAAATGARDGPNAAFAATAFILLLFGSVVLHELGHVTAASWYGIRTPDITLLPIGGVARLERIPRVPRQELTVALAGPAVTLLIALVAFLALRLGGGGAADAQGPAMGLVRQLLTANVILLGFNLLPAFPMDGGRVLRALLAMRMDYVAATRAAAAVGQAFALLFAVVGVLTNPFLLLIAGFVYLGARQEALAAELQEALAGLSVSAAMVTEFRALDADDTLADAAEALLGTMQHDYPVLDAEGRPRGVLTRARLLDALARLGPGARVDAAMAVAERGLAPTGSLVEAYRGMQAAAAPLLPVVDDAGRLVGLLTPENLAELVQVRAALARVRPGPSAPDGLTPTRAASPPDTPDPVPDP